MKKIDIAESLIQGKPAYREVDLKLHPNPDTRNVKFIRGKGLVRMEYEHDCHASPEDGCTCPAHKEQEVLTN